MPFAKTWTEELVAEWLHLKGYLVEIGFPAGVAFAGGRYEVDVVGGKITSDDLEIVHAEVGTLGQGKNSINSLEKKFSEKYCEAISLYFKQIFGYNGKITYKKIYIASYWTKPVIEGASRFGVTVIPLTDFIKTEIIPTIDNWKKNPPHSPRTKGSYLTLSESNWLLELIDYLNSHKLINYEKR